MSSSSSDTKTTNEYQTNNESITFGVEGDNPNAINGDNNSINVQSLDGDTINRAFDFGLDALMETQRSVIDVSRDANDLAQMAIGENSRMSEKVINATSDNLYESLDWSDRQSERFTNALSDNSALTQQALLEMGVRQERSLDSALDVARSVAIDDDAEFAGESVKWIAGALVAGTALMAFAGRK